MAPAGKLVADALAAIETARPHATAAGQTYLDHASAQLKALDLTKSEDPESRHKLALAIATLNDAGLASMLQGMPHVTTATKRLEELAKLWGVDVSLEGDG